MLKNKFKNSKKVKVEKPVYKTTWDEVCYSTENKWADDLDDLNEIFFDRNRSLMKQLESVQMGF